MTRLTEDDLERGPVDLEANDKELRAVTGLGLLELALRTADMTVEQYRQRAAALSWVAVIPVTVGQGIISGFSAQVAEVGCFLGLPCRVTRGLDVTGLGEAVAGGSGIIILADDDSFLALNLISRRVVDNRDATGMVFAVALDAAAGGVAGQQVGVLGLGPVGQAAADWLHSRGARLIVHDREQKKQSGFLAGRTDVAGANSVDEVLAQTSLVLDATSSADIIKPGAKRLILSAPGVPVGIADPDSDGVRLIYNPLQLGVAAMIVQAIA